MMICSHSFFSLTKRSFLVSASPSMQILLWTRVYKVKLLICKKNLIKPSLKSYIILGYKSFTIVLKFENHIWQLIFLAGIYYRIELLWHYLFWKYHFYVCFQMMQYTMCYNLLQSSKLHSNSLNSIASAETSFGMFGEQNMVISLSASDFVGKETALWQAD